MGILAFDIVGLWTNNIWPILMLVVGFGLVIFVHEGGHFLVAKMVGIKVERFALGFGPRLFGFGKGETDYCVNLLPLGGYVKMLGQEDFAKLEDGEVDPRAFCNKSVGARFAVISAGVIMNVIFAGVTFVVLGMIGISFPAPVVGSVQPGWPAAEAKIEWADAAADEAPAVGLQPGDRIVAIEGEGLLMKLLGKKVTRFNRVMIVTALSDKDDVYTVTIEREVDGRKRTGRTKLGVRSGASRYGSGSKMFKFGMGPAADTVFLGVAGEVDDPFLAGDRVVVIGDKDIQHYWEMEPIEASLTGEPVPVIVLREGKRVPVTVQPQLIQTDTYFLADGSRLRGKIVDTVAEKDEKGDPEPHCVFWPDGDRTRERLIRKADIGGELLDVLGMAPRIAVAEVLPDTPAAKAGIQPGDILAAYGDQSAPSRRLLGELNEKFAGEGTNIVVQRAKETLAPVRIVPDKKTKQIGLALGVDVAHLVLSAVRTGSPAARAGLESGDTIETVNGQAVTTWIELIDRLGDLVGQDVTLTYRRGVQKQEAALGKLGKSEFDRGGYELLLFGSRRLFRTLEDPPVKLGPLNAIAWGAGETVGFLAVGYAQIRSLVRGTVSTKEIAGPVGIVNIGIQVGRDSVPRFVHFMAMISVFLAVVNFLPFPVVDGGHAVFLIIEKIRRKPLSIRVMNWVQGAGLALIAFVFIAVTWQDIMRLLK
jgi:regulator of sigma E protease